ncbi:MAG: ABC transporter permease [gamma proteobacterium symbiont of Bathyaustriella thionipta]|nr:ABC transporter permease [gamma proteobacterium symbiont of Bathyaustriella thionipta]
MGGLLRRILAALLTSLGVLLLVFFLLHLAPGDPVAVMLGDHARPADYTALRHALGLEQGLPTQLGHYLLALTQGDLGHSLHSQQTVSSVLAARIPATLQLALVALLFALLLAVPLGLAAALYKDRWPDHVSSSFALLGLSIPNFWLGPMLIMLFAIYLDWLPVSGQQGFASVLLPALTLGTSMAALLARMTRASVLDVLQEDYVRTAKAKGLPATQIMWRHVLRNAALPLLTLLGLQFGALLSGAVITELIFSWPGIGSLLIESIQQRDYPLVQGVVLLIALTYVTVNLLTDLAYARLDPRIQAD